MYTDKKNVLQLAALLKTYGIKQIVLSPGSRNSPLSHTFAAEPFFICHSVVDERSSAFYALGLIQAISEPVAVCCTSGSAALNFAPAVAEAFYQQIPLLVITADRPESQIGQMLGQTLPQAGLFNTLVKKAVHLPEISNAEDEWFCNRLINEAIQALEHNGKGPAHINIPLSEPLFNFTTEALPDVRKINNCRCTKQFENNNYTERFRKYNKRMIIVGQFPPSEELKIQLGILANKKKCVVLCEHLANLHEAAFINNFDEVLKTIFPEERQQYRPELLITLGGHVVSKRVNKFIREYPPYEHWHISESGDIVDTYRVLTDIIEYDAASFLHTITGHSSDAAEDDLSFTTQWKQASDRTPMHHPECPEEEAVQMLLQSIPENSSLHLANSSSVRYAQLYPLHHTIHVFCNRGTNGIEGSLSTAVGYAAASERQTFLFIGDLSFFYDMNGLWNRQLNNKLRIFLINNGCGRIFHTLKGLNQSEALDDYIAAAHHTTAKGWAESLGITYLSASDQTELKKQIPAFIDKNSSNPILFEYFPEKKKSEEKKSVISKSDN
ncbi:MAG: 2-succinyl-5-enolpyruvyl-6-hydroxy-3-cyclohexene-1-carboxylic-acid synthase [Tannerella sp.]|jgi:2-succinyl-5-enolpyruvyl-6-hydroxy-3-cyclohexene-1-carboxylate synthase|nr:2-succinyl-5-enolpyruvyl-6-hydroxy-3-cyclohexene-1-carboxylic-acid synthase [Tannerella sp.]